MYQSNTKSRLKCLSWQQPNCIVAQVARYLGVTDSLAPLGALLISWWIHFFSNLTTTFWIASFRNPNSLAFLLCGVWGMMLRTDNWWVMPLCCILFWCPITSESSCWLMRKPKVYQPYQIFGDSYCALYLSQRLWYTSPLSVTGFEADLYDVILSISTDLSSLIPSLPLTFNFFPSSSLPPNQRTWANLSSNQSCRMEDGPDLLMCDSSSRLNFSKISSLFSIN